MKKLVKKIAIVDDTPENLEAAVVAIAEFLPNVSIATFDSLKSFKKAVGKERPDFDLVLSDLNMEEEKSGFKVACLCWAWGVPTVIITGGMNHGSEAVKVGYFNKSIFGTKKETKVWMEALKTIFVAENKNPIYLMLLGGKKSAPNKDFGEIGGHMSIMSC